MSSRFACALFLTHANKRCGNFQVVKQAALRLRDGLVDAEHERQQVRLANFTVVGSEKLGRVDLRSMCICSCVEHGCAKSFARRQRW